MSNEPNPQEPQSCCCGCNPWGALTSRPLRLVLLGGPGVGKGTQAEILRNKLNLNHFSTGDLFRAITKSPDAELTPAMRQAKDFMSRGALVPDETVIGLVDEKLHSLDLSKGVLFDGFPRTAPQAESLDKMLAGLNAPLTAVLNYEVANEVLISRLSGRRTCLKCGASFHTANRPPKVEGVCDNCGSELVQRADDQAAAIKVRLDAYETSTRPLVEFYASTGRLVRIPADAAPELVAAATAKLLAAHLG